MNLYKADMGWEGGFVCVADTLEDAKRKLREHCERQLYNDHWIEECSTSLVEFPLTAVVELRGDT